MKENVVHCCLEVIMEIVDKEQERLAKERMPEGKRKKALQWLRNLVILAALAILYQLLK